MLSRCALFIPLLGLLACGTRATQEPCPGSVQGTVQVVGQLVEGEACAAAAGVGTIDLAFEVSFTADGGAAVCLQRPLADPLLGTHDGDVLEVSTPIRPGAATGCACEVQIAERITGTIAREGGTVTGFQGELELELSPADGSPTCAPADEGTTCAVPCRVRWTLSPG